MRVLKGKGGRVTALVFSPDGKTLAAGSTLRLDLWDVAAGTVSDMEVVFWGAEPDSLRFDPKGRRVLVGVGFNGGLRLIDVNDDGLVVSAGIDKTVHLWKIDGTPLHTWRGHTAGVKGISFVGRHVVSGSEDYTVRVWRLDDPPPPPRGTALKAWLDDQTNLTVGKAN